MEVASVAPGPLLSAFAVARAVSQLLAPEIGRPLRVALPDLGAMENPCTGRKWRGSEATGPIPPRQVECPMTFSTCAATELQLIGLAGWREVQAFKWMLGAAALLALGATGLAAQGEPLGGCNAETPGAHYAAVVQSAPLLAVVDGARAPESLQVGDEVVVCRTLSSGEAVIALALDGGIGYRVPASALRQMSDFTRRPVSDRLRACVIQARMDSRRTERSIAQSMTMLRLARRARLSQFQIVAMEDAWISAGLPGLTCSDLIEELATTSDGAGDSEAELRSLPESETSLTAGYKAARAAFREAGPLAEETLKRQERAWLRHRDAVCGFDAFHRGTSAISEARTAACYRHLNDWRTAELAILAEAPVARLRQLTVNEDVACATPVTSPEQARCWLLWRLASFSGALAVEPEAAYIGERHGWMDGGETDRWLRAAGGDGADSALAAHPDILLAVPSCMACTRVEADQAWIAMAQEYRDSTKARRLAAGTQDRQLSSESRSDPRSRKLAHNVGALASAQRQFFAEFGQLATDWLQLVPFTTWLYDLPGEDMRMERMDQETVKIVGTLRTGARCEALATWRAPVMVECN